MVLLTVKAGSVSAIYAADPEIKPIVARKPRPWWRWW